MTQDEIIEMARQAKAIPMHKDFNQLALIGTENLEAFAKLVAAKAIAELESQEPVAWLVEFENKEQELHFDKQSVGETQNPLYTHPPQRIEPPDWFPAVENILNEYGLQAIDFVADFKAAMKDAEKSQRTWVGLMDEEIEQSYETTGHYQKLRLQDKFAVYALAKAIEAKLKQKNGFAEEKNT